jgi:hypothetical protein
MNANSFPPINADEHGLKHRDLTEKLIGIDGIYNERGHGFLESVYEQAFAVAWRRTVFSSRGRWQSRSGIKGGRSEISERTC